MKPKQTRIFKSLTVSLSPATIALAVMTATPALAIDSIWTGTTTNIFNTGTNWSTTPTAPTANSDTATWNGTQPGALSILWNGQIGGFGGNGVGLFLTSGQTASVALNNTANASSLGVNGISIASGAGAFTLGAPIGTGSPVVIFRAGGSATSPPGFASLDIPLINNSSNPATIEANIALQTGGGSARSLVVSGTGDWLVKTALSTTNGGALTIVKNGNGTLTVTNANSTQNTAYNINAGKVVVGGSGLLGGPLAVFGGVVAINGTLSFESSGSQTISSAISGTGVLSQSAGTLTLTGNNSRTGATTITGGTMILSGTGQSASSGLTINGPTAKFVKTSTVASAVPITVTQGILDGTGPVGAVTVDGSGGNVRHGNGGTGALTIGSLNFTSPGSINITEDGTVATPGIVVTGALASSGVITVNASQTTWASGTTYDLMTFGSFGGTLANFTKGTITGLSTVRQTATLILGANKLSLQIAGDNPVWTGLDSGGEWKVGSTGANGNWKTSTGQTNYIAGDSVLFDDSITTGTTAVTIPTNVSPTLTTFNNSLNDYTVSGAAGIAGGALIKTGSRTVTISTANTYNGGTTVSDGTLALSGAGTLGASTGALTVNGAGFVDLGSTSQTVGTVSLSGTGVIANGTITPTSVSVTTTGIAEISASIAGGGSVTQAGSGLVTLLGANSYTGGTTANSGTLSLSGAGTLGATTGALNLGAANLDLGGTSQTVGAVTVSGPSTISNGTLSSSVFNANHTAGTVTVSAQLTGTGALNVNGGGGTLLLTEANSYSGPTFVASGAVLRLGNGGTSGSLNPLSPISMGNNGRFSTNRSDVITQGVDFGLLTGGIQGAVILNGTGTTILNMANDFVAASTITAGTVIVRNNQGLGTGGGGNFNMTGGMLHLQNDITLPLQVVTHGEAEANDTEGSIMSTGNNSLASTVVFNNAGIGSVSNLISLSGTLTFNGALSANTAGRTFNFGGAGNVVVAGAITGDVAVSKSGAGTTTLSSAGNTYTGETIIQNGTLRILSTIPGLTTIDGSGAVLAGNGTLGGNVTLANGGVAPGDGVTPIGTLSLTQNLVLSPTASSFNYDLSSADNTSDSLAITGVLTKGGGTVTFNFSGGKVGETYTLLQFASTDLVPADASAFAVTGGTGTFTLTGTTLTYTALTVPGSSGYAVWAASKGLSAGVNDGTGQDPDFDGISNLLEYVLGGLPIGTGSSNTSILPVQTVDATNVTLTFKRFDVSEVDTTQVVQLSSDLGTWTNFATIGAVSAGAVTVTEDSPTADLDTVSVVIPRAGNTVNGKFFARLQAVKNP